MGTAGAKKGLGGGMWGPWSVKDGGGERQYWAEVCFSPACCQGLERLGRVCCALFIVVFGRMLNG